MSLATALARYRKHPASQEQTDTAVSSIPPQLPVSEATQPSPLQAALIRYIGSDFARTLGAFEKALPLLEKLPGMGKIDSDQFRKLTQFASVIQGDATQAHKLFSELHSQLGVLLDADKASGIGVSASSVSRREEHDTRDNGIGQEHT